MKNETKIFDLETVLTVTTGRLLTKSKGPNDNGIGDLYEILSWITGDNLFTHQLPRAADECKPHLLKQFPELGEAESTIEKMASKRTPLIEWIPFVKKEHSLANNYEVCKLPAKAYTPKNPLGELIDMVGGEKNVVVVSPAAK